MYRILFNIGSKMFPMMQTLLDLMPPSPPNSGRACACFSLAHGQDPRFLRVPLTTGAAYPATRGQMDQIGITWDSEQTRRADN